MVIVDLPFSIFLLALRWRFDFPIFLWFGIFGTAWWYLLSWVAFNIYNQQFRNRA